MLNLAVFVLSVVLMLLSKVQVKSLLLMMLPILLFALGMFITGFRFAAGGDMLVNEKVPAGCT